jgi:D-amino-acid dehydrogenase
MKVLVIGSGLMGITTAYELGRCGHEVMVIDRAEGPARETSFANGALLTPSMAAPWNAPGSWRVLLSSLGRRDAPLKIHWRVLSGMTRWGIDFLRNSSASAYERNTRSNLRLARYSLRRMAVLQRELRIEFDSAHRGSLRLFRQSIALDQAARVADRLCIEGIDVHRLSATETVRIEPALGPIAKDLAGSLHYRDDETGDAYQFCVELAEHARKLGVDFRYRTQITSLHMSGGRITAAVNEQQRFVADRYVVAAGSDSARLLEPLGIEVPVRPVKGYSVTFPAPTVEKRLQIPVVDDEAHAVVVPLGERIRVVRGAEWAGYDLSVPQARVESLTRWVRRVLPDESFDIARAESWCGLRPMSADGVPIIGATPIANLLVNSGHGHLGWTMAMGSARLLADQLCGDSPGIDPSPYLLSRFAQHH